MQPLQLKNKILNWNDKTYIMGILNITPDSFSGDGLIKQGQKLLDDSLHIVEEMLSNGADIIDIGGESSRPGSIKISTEEEISRIAPIIEAITKRLDIIISIDTYKSEVANIALEIGASIVNDIWALQADPNMASIVAKFEAAVILMHNSSDARKISNDPIIGSSYQGILSENIVDKIKTELQDSILIAQKSGIKSDKIILDPGFGFGKSFNQNIKILKEFDAFSSLGYPILSGPSRKSFIGNTLNLPVSERLEGTLAAIALLVERGANIVRVHDVKEAKRVVHFVDAVFKQQ